MRFLADESCDFAVVRALRSADHDVLAITEVSPREEDQDVMERAVREGRLLITEHGRSCQANLSHIRSGVTFEESARP